MFRLIALALTSTFALLAVIGTTDDPRAPAPAAVTAQTPDSAAPQYVTRHHQALKAEPDIAAGILQILPYGAALIPMGEIHGDFTKVRDNFGRVGFVRSEVLSAAFPG